MSAPTSSNPQAEWLLQDARVVGALKRGGAIVEEGHTLTIREGRNLHIYGEIEDDDAPRRERLEYEFTFEVEADEPPQCMMSEWARIVVMGTDEEGHRLSIEGNGWIGFDEGGRPQGSFLKPPKIRVILGDDPADALKKEVAAQWKRSPSNPANTGTIQ